MCMNYTFLNGIGMLQTASLNLLSRPPIQQCSDIWKTFHTEPILSNRLAGRFRAKCDGPKSRVRDVIVSATNDGAFVKIATGM